MATNADRQTKAHAAHEAQPALKFSDPDAEAGGSSRRAASDSSAAGSSPQRSAFSALAQRAVARRQPEQPPSRAPGRDAPHVPPARHAQNDPPWENVALPAGSQYTDEEWAAARASGDVDVCEVRSGAEGALVAIARDPERHARRSQAAGHPARPAQPAAKHREGDFPPLLGLLIDGCLLLGPKAPTTHPGAVTGHITLQLEDGVEWPYRIVRPAAQKDTHGWMTSVTGRLEWDPGATARRLLLHDECAMNSTEGDRDDDDDDEDASGFQQMRG